MCPPRPGLDGADRPTESCRDLGLGQAFLIGKEDDLAFLTQSEKGIEHSASPFAIALHSNVVEN